MKLAVLGATGRVGSGIVKAALNDGHEVHVLARNPEKLQMTHQNLMVVNGDAVSKPHLEEVMKSCDAVISALGTDGGTVLTDSISLILQVMKERGMKRILTVGTAGILESRTEPGLLRYQSNESKRKLTRAAEEHHRVYRELQQSGLEWTIICPTYLPDGPLTGEYRVEKNYLPVDGKQISTADTADFVYKQWLSGEFLNCRVGIAY